MKKYFFWAFFLFFTMHFLCADWIWNPETGWINSKYDPRESAKELYTRGQKLSEEGKPAEAMEHFRNLIKFYPNTPEGKNALYLAAECEYKVGRYYEAYLLYEEYLKEYPTTGKLQEILEREYKIATLLLEGKGASKSVLGLPLSSSESLGIEILTKIVQNAPYVSFADDAQLLMGDYHLRRRNYKEAGEAYEKLIKNYPSSEWRARAQYQIAICYLRQFKGTSWDSSHLYSAQKALNEYLLQYPEGKEIERVQKKKQEILETLAKKELEIGMFYWRNNRIHSARVYFQYIVHEFPGTEIAKQARTMSQRLKNQ